MLHPLLCRYESYDKPSSILLSSNANSYLREHSKKYPHFAPTVKPPMSYDYTIGEDEDDGFSFGGGRNDISEEFTSAFYSPITYDYTIGEEFGPPLPPKRRPPPPQPSRRPSSSPRPPMEHQVKYFNSSLLLLCEQMQILITDMPKKANARLRDPAIWLPLAADTSSRNLAFAHI